MIITNAFYGIIQKFAQEVGMKEAFAQSLEVTAGAILIIALLSCFFGLKLVRLCSAVMTFFLTAIAICEMLRPTAHMGVIVTTFALVGLIAAFLVYQWYKVGVFLLSAIMGYSIAAVFTADILVCFAAAVILGAVSLAFSPIVVIVSTSVWGGITLGFDGLPYIGIHLLPACKVIAAAGLAASGLSIQCLTNNTHLIPGKNRSYGKHAAKNQLKREVVH